MAIIVLKLHGYHQVWITFVPVGIMLAYAAFVLSFRRLRVRLDQAGDNLYYLGFLFTLTSLAFSLWEFAIEKGDATSIIGNFGIAIGTTIVGLMLRVAFNQMRLDPAETEQLSRIELAEAARRMRAELDHASLDFNMYRRTLHQTLTDGYAEMREATEATLISGLNSFKDNMKGFSESVIDAQHGVEQRSEQFDLASSAVATNLTQLAKRINEIELSEDSLMRLVTPAMKTIEAAAGDIHALIDAEIEAAKRREEIQVSLAASSKEVAELLESIKIASRHTEDTLHNIADAAAKFSNFKRPLQDPSLNVDRSGSGIQNKFGNAGSVLLDAGHHVSEEIRKKFTRWKFARKPSPRSEQIDSKAQPPEGEATTPLPLTSSAEDTRSGSPTVGRSTNLKANEP